MTENGLSDLLDDAFDAGYELAIREMQAKATPEMRRQAVVTRMLEQRSLEVSPQVSTPRG